MTDVVIPSRDRTAVANAESAVNRDGATERVIPSSERYLELPEENLGSGALDAFEQNGISDPSGNDWELTIKSGEAFVGGSYVARDTTTTVAGDFVGGERTVAVGWEHDSPDGLIVQPADDFGARDRSLEVYRVVDDGGSPVIDADLRPQETGFVRDDIQARNEIVADTYSGTGDEAVTIALPDFASGQTLDTRALEIVGSQSALVEMAGPSVTHRLVDGDYSMETIVSALQDEWRLHDRYNGDDILVKPFDAAELAVLNVALDASAADVFKAPQRASDPSSPDNGDVWYRSDLDEYRGVENGNKVTFDTTQV